MLSNLIRCKIQKILIEISILSLSLAGCASGKTSEASPISPTFSLPTETALISPPSTPTSQPLLTATKVEAAPATPVPT